MRCNSAVRPQPFVGCALLLCAANAFAQSAPARLHGRVTDKASAKGLAHAEVVVMGGGRSTRTDSSGNFTIGDLPNGSVQLLFRALGFEATHRDIDVHSGEDLERNVALDSAANTRGPELLSAVHVTESTNSNYRLVDFERRRRTGRGHYLTDEEIRASGANTLQAAVRGLRGVNFECRADGVCRIHMARALNNCDPQYVVDSRVDNLFGPDTPIRDIVGLEVYTGPSDVPGEFAGRDAGCGVVVIWTRSGPSASRR